MPKRPIPFAAPAALSLALGAQGAMQVAPDWPQLPEGWKLGQGSGVSVGRDGHVYLLHRGERPFLLFDPSGKVTRHWGDGLFTWPHGIRVAPDGNVWITDGGTGWWPTPNPIPGRGHVVLEFDPAGKLLRTFGRQGESGEDPEHFNGPADVAFAPNGDFYVADGYGNSRIVKFSKKGRYLRTWGRKGSAEGEFNLPHALAIDREGRLWVADRENLRIQVFNPDGRFLFAWKHVGRPIGIALDPDGNVYVADANSQRILVLRPDGGVAAEFGTGGDAAGELGGVHHIAVGPDGAFYTAELRANRFQKFIKR